MEGNFCLSIVASSKYKQLCGMGDTFLVLLVQYMYGFTSHNCIAKSKGILRYQIASETSE